MKIVAFLLFTLSVVMPKSCNQEMTTDIALDIPIALKINESATFDNGESLIQFSKVVEDSRCPANTQCMWEGQSKMKFRIYKKTEEIYNTITLNNSGKAQKNASFIYDEYLISISKLSPYPGTTDFFAENYTVTLLITKK